MEQIFINVRYYLHTPQSIYSHIEMRVRHKKDIIRINIKNIKVKTSQWSQISQRAIISNIQSDLDNYNNKIANMVIEDYRNKLDDFINAVIADNLVFLPSQLKKYFSMGRKPIHKLIEHPFDIYKWLIDCCISDKTITVGTQGNYKRGVEMFMRFNEYRTAQGYEAINTFAQIKSAVIDEFTDYLTEEPMNDGDYYALKTVETKLKGFVSSFHKYAHRSERITKEETSLVGYTLPQAKGAKTSYHIALRDDEVLQLWRYKCETKEDEQIKDMFLMLCLVGVRVGDINQISKNIQYINGERRLTIHQNKTQQMLGDGSIGIIFQLANNILDKYSDRLPPMNAKKINENIGRIARNAGVGTQEVVHITRQYSSEAEKRIEVKERCDMIKSHTGRRTFATILAHHGWSNSDIMTYTGHQKEDTFKGYCKKTRETQAIFEKTLKERPEDILVITDTYISYGRDVSLRTPIPTVTPVQAPPTNTVVADVAEAYTVLNFLGANEDDYLGTNDISQLIRIIGRYEGRIIDRFADKINIEKLKQLFNSDRKISERKKALHALFSEILQQDK